MRWLLLCHRDKRPENAAPPGREDIPVRRLLVGWQAYKMAGHTASTVREQERRMLAFCSRPPF